MESRKSKQQKPSVAETKPTTDDTKTAETKKDTKGRNSKGQFTKGRQKTGGRKLGTKNRNGNVRDRLKEQVEPYIDQIGEMLVRVSKEEGTSQMLTLMEKFMPYFMPKYSALSIGADMDRPVDEEQSLLELDAKYTKKELSINFKTMIVVDNDAANGDFDPDEDPNFDLSQLETTSE